jgi:hypothetical protein
MYVGLDTTLTQVDDIQASLAGSCGSCASKTQQQWLITGVDATFPYEQQASMQTRGHLLSHQAKGNDDSLSNHNFDGVFFLPKTVNVLRTYHTHPSCEEQLANIHASHYFTQLSRPLKIIDQPYEMTWYVF